jgi:RimJ/RimL family protein N-acetyltransferase
MSRYAMRPIGPSDAAFIVELHSSAHARDFFPVAKLEWVEHRLADRDVEHWIVYEGDERVGMVAFARIQPWLFEIRIMPSKHQRRGIGTFAFEAALERIFVHHRAHKAYLEVHARNALARRLYERRGFTYEGTYRDGAVNPQTGAYEDLCIYGMLEDEYRDRRA